MCNLYRLEKSPDAIRRLFADIQIPLGFPAGLPNFEPGHVRMRKSNTPPRDIHELTRRIREMDTSEDQGSGAFKRKGRS